MRLVLSKTQKLLLGGVKRGVLLGAGWAAGPGCMARVTKEGERSEALWGRTPIRAYKNVSVLGLNVAAFLNFHSRVRSCCLLRFKNFSAGFAAELSWLFSGWAAHSTFFAASTF